MKESALLKNEKPILLVDKGNKPFQMYATGSKTENVWKKSSIYAEYQCMMAVLEKCIYAVDSKQKNSVL